MLSGQQIREFQQQAARKAARAKRQPITVFSAESAERDLRSSPNLGTYLAKGWKRLIDLRGKQPESYFESVCDNVVTALSERAKSGSRGWAGHVEPEDFRLFIDKSGFGDSREPALSLDEAVEEIESALRALAKVRDRQFALGLGIVEEGQFQCYVGLFLREITPTKAKREATDWRARQKGDA